MCCKKRLPDWTMLVLCIVCLAGCGRAKSTPMPVLSTDTAVPPAATATAAPPKNVSCGHNGNVIGAAFSADGLLLASSRDDGMVRLWDVETGQALRLLRHGGEGMRVAFSPDGSLLACDGADYQVYLWGMPR